MPTHTLYTFTTIMSTCFVSLGIIKIYVCNISKEKLREIQRG